MTYLDHAATTEPHEEVIAAMQPYLEDHYCNPSAVYATAEAEAVRNARTAVADLLGTSARNIVFTGGGSEAGNLALKGPLKPLTGNTSSPRLSNTQQWWRRPTGWKTTVST